MAEIIPTCVPDSFEKLLAGAEGASEVSPALHIDIDDGIFAPHLTWPYTAPGTFGDIDLSTLVDRQLEVHLMVEESHDLGVACAEAGASRIIGHIEGFADTAEARAALTAWRGAGAREVGFALLLGTPFAVVEPLVAECDVVQLMTIASVGVQGIPYDPSASARVAELHALHPQLLISVDGGVSEKNIADLARAGARRFCVGSAISKAADPKAMYEKLLSLAVH